MSSIGEKTSALELVADIRTLSSLCWCVARSSGRVSRPSSGVPSMIAQPPVGPGGAVALQLIANACQQFSSWNLQGVGHGAAGGSSAGMPTFPTSEAIQQATRRPLSETSTVYSSLSTSPMVIQAENPWACSMGRGRGG